MNLKNSNEDTNSADTHQVPDLSIDEASLPSHYDRALRKYLSIPAKDHIARWEKSKPFQPSSDLSEATKPDASNMNQTMSVLKNRYLCRRQIASDAHSEAWLGADSDANECLVRIWPYTTAKPDDPAHALWNSELRMLYRLGSSPSAQQTMLTLRDAGIDGDSKAFVMVLQSDSGGFSRLSDLLKQRNDHLWLNVKNLRTNPIRGRVWQALHRIAIGIDSLHRQHVIHRNLTAENIYLDTRVGPESCRLGGFEWSVRLGVSVTGQGTGISPWATPPETVETVAGLTFQTDWYAFGMLCARFLLPLEYAETWGVAEMNLRIIEQVDNNPGGLLSELEQSLILRLIDSRREERLVFSLEIINLVGRIARDLLADRTHLPEDRPLVLAFDPKNSSLIEYLVENGFIPDPADIEQPFGALDVEHVARVRDFLRTKLADARLYLRPDTDEYVLAGSPPLTLLVAPFRDYDGNESWDVAYILKGIDLRMGRDPIVQDLCHLPLRVVTKGDAFRTTESLSWDLVRPRAGHASKPSVVLREFHNFLRCTNQLDLLLCFAEIFSYEVVDRRVERGMTEVITIREREDQRNLPSFCEIEDGMFGHLSRTYEAARQEYDKVFLTSRGTLHVPDLSPVVDPWYIDLESFDHDRRQIRLSRPLSADQTPAPDIGFVRTYGLYGQLSLIDRRKQAIDRLEEYAYLLSALAQPGQVCLDTEMRNENEYELPSEKVDFSKRAVIEEIERVRPIYALNGPPGTGKTTLVGHFLRRVFTDDHLAQVLVTAQAHAAVEVLRSKVREVYSDLGDDKQPLAIRLGARGQSGNDSDAVDSVTRRILRETRDALRALTTPTALQRRWREVLEVSALDQAGNTSRDPFIEDFAQMVKRSASITYCTTSAGDLAELIRSSESFDWSFDWAIVEEAGKVHGFDLALPLQTGHRWLLLGDHKQLPPYSFEDFEDGLDQLDGAVAALQKLPDRILVDDAWIRLWSDSTPEDKARFKQYAERWLKTFKELFRRLEIVRGSQGRVTRDASIGAWVGELSVQWRMHSTIGDLISKTFYKDSVQNGKVIENKFYFAGLSSSNQPVGRAIVWVDTPWCQNADGAEWKEWGPHRNRPRFTNPKEADVVASILRQLRLPDGEEPGKVAVLSAYAQQVGELRNRLRTVSVPGIAPVPSIQRSETGGPLRWVHTVDSFQGNQADAVIVSLVRNNGLLPEKGLGFLKEQERINVLLSRAERMLVLVGSWDFLKEQVRTVAIDDENHRLWFWKKALAIIQDGFETGKALRIAASVFTTERT
jgi:serine/threonine protein kinase